MPSRGETWIKTQTGWRTLKTIVICNNRDPFSPVSSDSESEEICIARPKYVCGTYWQSGPPFVILPGDSRTKSEFFFITRNSSDGSSTTSVTTIFNKLSFKQSIKSIRRFNYVTKLLEIVLMQDLVSTNSSSQKRLLMLFEQLVSTEINVHVIKRLLVVFKNRHISNKCTMTNLRLWNHVLKLINEMQKKIDRFQVKKLCKSATNCHLKLTELPVEALRLILRCFTDHQDIANIALVNRYFYKLTNEAGLWKSLCLFHLPVSKLKAVDANIPSSWINTYRKIMKRSSLRQTFAETLVICSHCHFIFWKNTSHDCSYDPKATGIKVPIIISITPRGFCYLFEK